jgi:hypothetical protein
MTDLARENIEQRTLRMMEPILSRHLVRHV